MSLLSSMGKRMKYLINDTLVDDRLMTRCRHFGLEVVSASSLSKELTTHFKWSQFQQSRTLFVFPGNGGSTIRSHLPAQWLSEWQWTSVFAKRYWTPGQAPEVEVGRVGKDQFRLDLYDIVVVDDVVSSGETSRLLKERNEPWMPRARWHVATWMMQKAANLPGFSSVLAILIVGERNRKVPVNSLSTFLSVPEIAENYARRNLNGQTTAFLEFIQELRNATR